jgi:hypothetical protein
MKLRLAKQSLRFRLTPEDIADLQSQKSLRESLHLDARTSWAYDLVLSPAAQPHIAVTGPHVQISLPEKELLTWCESPELAWNFEQTEPKLKVIIEKDIKPHRP